MHDAQLHRRFRIDRLDGFREALEPVDTGDEDILHASGRLLWVTFLGKTRKVTSCRAAPGEVGLKNKPTPYAVPPTVNPSILTVG